MGIPCRVSFFLLQLAGCYDWRMGSYGRKADESVAGARKSAKSAAGARQSAKPDLTAPLVCDPILNGLLNNGPNSVLFLHFLYNCPTSFE